MKLYQLELNLIDGKSKAYFNLSNSEKASIDINHNQFMFIIDNEPCHIEINDDQKKIYYFPKY